MILYYVDESGTGLKDKSSPFFVLAAMALPAKHCQTVDQEVAALKSRWVPWAKPEDFEIKGRHMRRGELFFGKLSWAERAQAILETADLVAGLRGRLMVVQVDKRDLPVFVASEEQLYRLAFWRLLDEVEGDLGRTEESGMLMLDMRSDLHSSVQDRRLIDNYRDWVRHRHGSTRLVDLPWFGFSAFYAGLQLADFTAYLVDCVANEADTPGRASTIHEAFARLQAKLSWIRIP